MVAAVAAVQFQRLKLTKFIHPDALPKEQSLLKDLFQSYAELEKIEEKRSDLEFDWMENAAVDLQEFSVLLSAINQVDLHGTWSEIKT